MLLRNLYFVNCSLTIWVAGNIEDKNDLSIRLKRLIEANVNAPKKVGKYLSCLAGNSPTSKEKVKKDAKHDLMQVKVTPQQNWCANGSTFIPEICTRCKLWSQQLFLSSNLKQEGN